MREEITRLSRRASRQDLESMRKASAQQRRHIAALKRDVSELSRQLHALSRRVPTAVAKLPEANGGKPARFVPRGLRSHRERLGLSAEQLGKLVGVSAQSIYNWESGTTRPREAQLGVLAGLRTLGKREAQARVEQLAAKAPKRRKS
jgi:DNA-binding transcriptional regulator YiaG